MSESDEFRDLIRRIRAGDPDAAVQLVREYEPEIRRAIRIRLTDPRLCSVLDSMDICQSVLGNFFTRAAVGQFDLEEPQQLLKLLITMARNKLRDQARREHADRRDNRRVVRGSDEALLGVAGDDSSPSQIVSNRELLDEVRKQFTDEERYLAEQRALGKEWTDLAAELNDSPEALRKRLSRAMDRASKKLGLE